MRDPVLNAFAVPGGKVVLHSGLILAAESPEEIAGVLAHEIAHVTRQHSMRQLVSTLGLYLLAQAFLGDMQGLMAVLLDNGSYLLTLKFSRDHESDADEVGLGYMRAAGIDPQGMVEMFRKLQAAHEEMNEEMSGEIEEATGAEDLSMPDFLSTHPDTGERIEAMQKLLEQSESNNSAYYRFPLDFKKFQKRVAQSFMKSEIKGQPSFCYIHVDLEPGESVIAESDAMASMAAELDMETSFNGGFFSGLLKKFLGGESLFINKFTNNTDSSKRVTLVQATPGEVREVQLSDSDPGICLQPGAYVCSTPGIKLGIKWVGFGSFIGREGLFKLMITGSGTLWYGAYGGLFEREIDGEFIVDTAHLVAYQPSMKLKVQLAGGIIASFLGGEGLVTRVEGKGKITLQSRSLSGLAGWVNPRL